MNLIFLIFYVLLTLVIIFKMVIIDSNRDASILYRNSEGFVTSKDIKKGSIYTVTVTLNTGRVITLDGVENYDNVEVGKYVFVKESYYYNHYSRLIKKETILIE